ncbi:MAG: hypothetical protein M3Z40_01750 [Bifidobacterium sp.]|nr:hypothetical protein [Bifidobacterium sp.]
MTSSGLRERILTWAQARYTSEQTAKPLCKPAAEGRTVVDQKPTTEKGRA